MSAWVAFTILAALMQAIRTAGQKQLSNSVSPMSTTLVRYVYGLPFAIAYLFLVASDEAVPLLSKALLNQRFLVFAFAAGVAQIIATVLLIKLFSFRNFAVGTSFAKTEAIQTAVIGTVLFQSSLGLFGWLAVFLGVIGIVIVSLPEKTVTWDRRNISLGLLSGTAFSLTSLWLREASLSLDTGVLQSAATTLVVMVSLQSILCLAYTASRESGQIALILERSGLALFVGLTSALGSVGWFTAMTYQDPALVKSLGQIEFVFTVLLTTMFFRETISRREGIGLLAIVTSVIFLLMFKA